MNEGHTLFIPNKVYYANKYSLCTIEFHSSPLSGKNTAPYPPQPTLTVSPRSTYGQYGVPCKGRKQKFKMFLQS